MTGTESALLASLLVLLVVTIAGGVRLVIVETRQQAIARAVHDLVESVNAIPDAPRVIVNGDVPPGERYIPAPPNEETLVKLGVPRWREWDQDTR